MATERKNDEYDEENAADIEDADLVENQVKL